MSAQHRGLSRAAAAWHFLAALGGEYGPQVQRHLTGRLLGEWLHEVTR